MATTTPATTDRTSEEWRTRLWSDAAMMLCALAFGALAVNEVVKQVQDA